MSMQHFVCEPDAYLEPKLSADGYGARPATTSIQSFKDAVEKHGDRPALYLKRKNQEGKLPDQWKIWSWREYYADCVAFAKSLIASNVPLFHVVNMIGFNSPEWVIANMGAILAGDIAAGIYTSNTADACHYVSAHSKAEFVVCEGNAQLAKYAKIEERLPDLKGVIVWGETPDPSIVSKFARAKVFTWDEWLQVGQDVSDQAVTDRQNQVRPGNCSTLIYTSGTTGPPKAVMISHDNVTWTVANLLDNYLEASHLDRFLSYLPLSHIAAQMIDIHAPMHIGGSTWFAQPDALKGTLTASMKECKPTIFFGVPRVWEKIHEKMAAIGRESTGIKKSLGSWAKGLGADHCDRMQFGQGGGSSCGYGCANSLVLSKIKEALGLDQARACFTAAAPISVETLRYFSSLDIPVYEVFGQSECTGPHTVGCPSQWKIGTCGRPMLGTETMIAEGSRELCYRGRHIFMGYMHMPDKTAETIDGEVSTGQGVLDESAITGEAEFIHKGPGAKVMSGSIVQNGYLEIVVSVELKDSMMRKLNDTVNDVQASKGVVATIVDSFAAYWTPLIVLAAVVFVAIGGSATGQWHAYVNKGLVLLVLACPCSIVLAAPVASLSGIAAAAKHGVVIKGSEVIEMLGTIDAVAMDKTGTLTKGSFSVLDNLRFRTDKEDDEDAEDELYDPLKLAAALEDKSSHPLASAIVSKFCGCIAEMKNPLPNSKKIHINEGVGVEGWVEASPDEWVHVAVGNDRMLKNFVSLKQNNDQASKSTGGKPLPGSGKCRLKKEQQFKLNEFISKYPACTVVFVAVDDELAGCIALGDVVRPESKATVAQLTAMKCSVVMLTGDAASVADQTCRELHIEECFSRLHPEDKYRCVNELKERGKKVLMLGDGINDTTALAAADVGVAMGAAGSAMAVKAADVVLMSDSLTKLPSTIAMGQLTRALIFENVIFSVAVKIVAIILALTGYMELWHAILIDIGTLFVVIANGTRPLCSGIYERNENLDAGRSRSAFFSVESRIQQKISVNTGNPERHSALQTTTAAV